jgi:hypothetical protein
VKGIDYRQFKRSEMVVTKDVCLIGRDLIAVDESLLKRTFERRGESDRERESVETKDCPSNDTVSCLLITRQTVLIEVSKYTSTIVSSGASGLKRTGKVCFSAKSETDHAFRLVDSIINSF